MASGLRPSRKKDSRSWVRFLHPTSTYNGLTRAFRTDPGTGKTWATCTDMAAEDVDNTVQAAHQAFKRYRTLTPRQRGELLYKWDVLIRDNKDDIAKILVYETGKPLAEAHGEIDYATSFTRWFAAEAERIQGTVFQPAVAGRRVFTIKQPIGVAAALVPWNFPIA